jgi:hypothetical protein
MGSFLTSQTTQFTSLQRFGPFHLLNAAPFSLSHSQVAIFQESTEQHCFAGADMELHNG